MTITTNTDKPLRGHKANLVFAYALAFLGVLNVVLFIVFSIADYRPTLLINLFIGLFVLFQAYTNFRRYYRPYWWELR